MIVMFLCFFSSVCGIVSLTHLGFSRLSRTVYPFEPLVEEEEECQVSISAPDLLLHTVSLESHFTMCGKTEKQDFD